MRHQPPASLPGTKRVKVLKSVKKMLRTGPKNHFLGWDGVNFIKGLNKRMISSSKYKGLWQDWGKHYTVLWLFSTDSLGKPKSIPGPKRVQLWTRWIQLFCLTRGQYEFSTGEDKQWSKVRSVKVDVTCYFC